MSRFPKFNNSFTLRDESRIFEQIPSCPIRPKSGKEIAKVRLGDVFGANSGQNVKMMIKKTTLSYFGMFWVKTVIAFIVMIVKKVMVMRIKFIRQESEGILNSLLPPPLPLCSTSNSSQLSSSSSSS